MERRSAHFAPEHSSNFVETLVAFLSIHIIFLTFPDSHESTLVHGLGNYLFYGHSEMFLAFDKLCPSFEYVPEITLEVIIIIHSNKHANSFVESRIQYCLFDA